MPKVLFPIALLVLGCGGNWAALPKFQSVAVSGSSVELEPFVGNWYDGEGNLWATIDSDSPPSVSIRLLPDFELHSAHVTGNELTLSTIAGGSPLPLALLSTGPDSVVVVRQGSKPSGCGTCTPYLSRQSRSWAAEQRVKRVESAVQHVHDAVMAKLSELL